MKAFIHILIALIFILPVGTYMYYFIERITKFFGNMSKATRKKIVWIGTIIVLLPAIHIGNIWTIILIHIVGIGLCCDIIQMIVKVVKWNNKMWENIYTIGIIPIVATILIIAYGFFNVQNIVETHYTVETEKEIRQEGYKVAFLSDLHFGTTMDIETLERTVEKINEANADIVVLGGDIFDENTTKQEMEEAIEVLSTLNNKEGIFYVYGNHDINEYVSKPNYSVNELESNLVQVGINVLNDETYLINNELLIVGRKDNSFGNRLGSSQLLENENNNNFLLVIDHQPLDVTENSQNGYDLQLSGHTHNGQIFPLGIIMDVLGIYELNYGQKQIGTFTGIVSSGIGGWGYPIRTQSNCEYVIVDIVGR